MSNNFDIQQLQQELLDLFELDTEKYLQLYEEKVQQLNAESWKDDIQQIYRCVHTIKGGAVTVGAEPLLEVATVLEDLLSDLRYIDLAPPLKDGKLKQILTESGEFLVGSIRMSAVPSAAIARIQDLRKEVQTRFLPEWNEYSQLHQEFAEQGFDLMVLDLEMALETLPLNGQIPHATLAIAKQTIQQLQEIGVDLRLGKGWDQTIAQSQLLFEQPQANFWVAHWGNYLKSLKECAKHGGIFTKRSPSPYKIPEHVAKPLPNSSNTSEELATTDSLEQELLDLFYLDTQKDLQLYVDTVAQLKAESWTKDIQQLYRSVHTIKGGSVTVGAERILEIATVLEDLLSDLRFLEISPPLADGKLQKILTETGELLIGSLQSTHAQSSSNAIQRIQLLHEGVKRDYLSGWNEQKQLYREFAEQGFDLVVLELEMAIEQLPASGNVPLGTVETAQQTLAQLAEIGTDLGFAAEWQNQLLLKGQTLIANANVTAWAEQWMPYLRSLKEAAKLGGRSPKSPAPVAQPVVPKAQDSPKDPVPSKKSAKKKAPTSPTSPTTTSTANIQIPVPLERLDRSSQYLVETLMAARSTQGFYQSVQANLMPLVALAQDSVQYIGQLRDVQDDYALSEVSNSQDGLKVERYRQGYLAINRLLEISLRLIELGAETGEASRRTTESLQKLDVSLRSLQQTLEESRLLPFEALSFRARGILRDLTTRIGKPAEMFVRGEKLELDAGTLRKLEPILLHLLRNAYDHGLESREERARKGKPEQGKLEIALVRRGNVFLLEVKDDGKGIDPEQIRSIAQAKGLPLTDTTTPSRLLDVISQPGFTSAQVVTNISGRGVGMDVVANQVTALGGQLRLHSEIGVGTTFTIQIPVPQLFVRCMLLQTGDRVFAIPTAEVFTTMLLGDLLWKRVDASQNKPYTLTISENAGETPALDLSQYWFGDAEVRPVLPNAIAVRAKRLDSDRGVWFVADALMGQSDLLVNPLPSPLIAPAGMVGVSLTSEGKIIPVLDVLSLIDALLVESHAGAAAIASMDKPIQTDAIASGGLVGRQIVVVDDAALMRRRIESSLSSQGYNVRTCSDGQEAWEWLQIHTQPSVLITDIEMPRMDGFTLIDQCRQAGMDMPILVISSRLAEEWSRETQRLGATDYLTKGFATPELLQKVASLLEQSSSRQPLGV
ncbi:response regulator [Tumidithrix elongata RA019]|uniref:histidine kinase n=1 Tax=Tumidithrix elongata BACA0141 TaxID=2716417 RepID=A0AAW9Q040_9CYAN|nr:response regulator [Tumidithrix elongata RA019]